MIIGFIGLGNIGSSVVKGVIVVGYDVVMSNLCGFEMLVELIVEFGEYVWVVIVIEVGVVGDFVVVMVFLKVIGDVFVELFVGKFVIDMNNYYF